MTKGVTFIFLISFSLISLATGAQKINDCKFVKLPACNTNLFNKIPDGVRMVAIDDLPHSSAEHKKSLKKNAYEMKLNGFVKTEKADLFDKIPYDKIPKEIIDRSLEGKTFHKKLVRIMEDKFSILEYQGTLAYNPVTITYFFLIDKGKHIEFTEAYYRPYGETLDLPKEMINRTVAELPAILVTNAIEFNGKSRTTLQWADNTMYYNLKLYEHKRNHLLEAKLLEIANMITLNSQ